MHNWWHLALYHLELGEISSYPPGYKENAGIFCHTNPWIMIAETRLGHGDRAFDYYLRIKDAELARYDLSEDASTETAMIFGELYRHSGEWKFRARAALPDGTELQKHARTDPRRSEIQLRTSANIA